jgi:hypothetical protein
MGSRAIGWRIVGAAAGVLLCSGVWSGHDARQGLRQPWVASPYAGMYGSMGNVYSPYYRQFHHYGMQGMAPARPGQAGAPVLPWATGPYAGMYGSMGNVYSPYYRRHSAYAGPGTRGAIPAGGTAGLSTAHPVASPYSGMYGSMGNVYSPYYRRFHSEGTRGQAEGPRWGPVVYPSFLPPTMGTLAGDRPGVRGAGAR